MSVPAIIREADLRRWARVARKEGVAVRAEISIDGRVFLTIGPNASAPANHSNGFDEALG